MVDLPAFRKSFLPTVRLGKVTPAVETLCVTCLALFAGVPASDRKAMLQRLEKMQRSDDVRHLHAALFDTISQAHSESVARERSVQLDATLG